MAERADAEGKFVEVVDSLIRFGGEVAAADVVGEVAEEFVAERVVAEILDEAAAVGVGVGFDEFVRSGVGIALKEKRFYFVLPQDVNDLFMGEERVAAGGERKEEEEQEQHEMRKMRCTTGFHKLTPREP